MTDHDIAAADEGLTLAAYGSVVESLRAVSGLRLDDYRRASVLRHLQSRMRALQIEDLDGYVACLIHDRHECESLAREILESNTVLFRDPEAYAGLARMLPYLLDVSPAPRIWVPCCASGGDVYSIAMLLAEAQAALEAPESFEILGTDIDAQMLAAAGSGGFSASDAQQVPAHLRERYLSFVDGECRVIPRLAARCEFRLRDVTRELPVGGFDLVDCRNLIGSLQLPVQRSALEHFRAALRPGGLLLVGRGELMAAHVDLFRRVAPLPGLYQRVEPQARPSDPPSEAYRTALLSSTTPGAVLDAQGGLIEINPTLLRLSGRPAPELLGQSGAVLLQAADETAFDETIALLADGQKHEIAVPLRTPTALLPARLMLSRWQSGEAAFVLAEWRLEALPADNLAAQAATLLAASLRLMSESLIVTDTHGRIVEFNRSAERLTGWPRAQAIGLGHESVLRLIGAAGAVETSPVSLCLRDPNAIRRGEEHQLLSRDGRRLRVRLSYSPLIGDGEISGVILMLEDTTEQTLLADELEYRSSHDALTGLFNRGEFERRVSAALTEARAGAAPQMLCYIDVDQFKVINDTLGHYAGDELLRDLATLLRAHLRPDDALARLGGDEYGVLLKDLEGEAGRALVETLLAAVRGFRFQWEAKTYAITVSIGVVEIDRRSGDIVSTLADADAACYAAKDGGRDRARWVSDGHDEIRARHAEMTMVGRIGKALDEGLFLLFYEDVVATTATTQVCYRELLVRMRGDDGRLVQPGGFIAAAERYYLMAALDRWVLSTAFAGIASLPADGIIYAVNVSGMSLSDDQFLNYVVRAIERTGVAPERICFEITETSAISHLSEAVRFISHLAELGCRFALDDFGAGMASFSYLKNLPVQFVKIDGSFVRNMQGSTVDRGMVEAINRIGHDMGLCTIAEHVEDASALQMLAAIGVDWVQGTVIGEGRPFDELLAHANS
ncbi:EAL domain-containing protein [Hydrocarboniphaga sp.]|uniref:EAL domain-containing protein n=1 Tax=Hydrocarboniphaga sp. TaxID=2033016 RepID=UPI0026017A90|nr:EAL domain-containing protein [Hydrocarboniphaga sp.]